MYNGIGLPTARGSGTNGFVQRNLAFVSKKRQMRPKVVTDPEKDIDRQPNLELILHQKKREIEGKCIRLRAELENEGWSHRRIEEEIAEYRARKLDDLSRISQDDHDKRLRKCFGIDELKMKKSERIEENNGQPPDDQGPAEKRVKVEKEEEEAAAAAAVEVEKNDRIPEKEKRHHREHDDDKRHGKRERRRDSDHGRHADKDDTRHTRHHSRHESRSDRDRHHSRRDRDHSSHRRDRHRRRERSDSRHRDR